MAKTTATVSTSRGAGIIIVSWTSGEDSSKVRKYFREALANFDCVDVDKAQTGPRLYINVSLKKLNELSPDDREKTWVGLREQVGKAVSSFFPRI